MNMFALLPIDLIDRNPHQPRRVVTHLAELTESIKKKGVLVPIRVQRKGDRYRIVYGERRWRAATDAGLRFIPCLVSESATEDIDELSLVENEHRENLNVVDRVMAVREFSPRGYPGKDISLLIGKSAAHVSKCLAIAEFLAEAMAGGFLTYSALAESDPGPEFLYLASRYAAQTDLGFGADLLQYATYSGLTREEMQDEAERRIAERESAVVGEKKKDPRSAQLGSQDGDDASDTRRQSGSEAAVRPYTHRWQITATDHLTAGRMIRILDTASDVLGVLSSLADADLEVSQAGNVAEALERAIRGLSETSLAMKRLLEKAGGR